MEGWIKLHRKIVFSKQFQNPNELKVWIWMICKASRMDRVVALKIGKGYRSVSIKRGQFIFGRHAAEVQLYLDGSMIYRMLDRFQADGCIKVEPHNQFSIITLLHFDEYQSEEDEDFLELEEDRTTNEQPMNNGRTTNEHQSNTNRTAIEQRANTNNTVNNSREWLEGLEGGESEEKGTSASAAVSADQNPDLKTAPAEADLPPLSGASPPSNGKKPRKAREDLEGRFLDIYSRWMDECQNMPAKLDGTQVKAAQALIIYIRKLVERNSKEKNIVLLPAELDQKILNGWGWFLSKWLNLEPHYQDKLLLTEINSKFPNLYKQALNGSAKDKPKAGKSGNGGGAINQAERIINKLNQRDDGRIRNDAAGNREAS